MFLQNRVDDAVRLFALERMNQSDHVQYALKLGFVPPDYELDQVVSLRNLIVSPSFTRQVSVSISVR